MDQVIDDRYSYIVKEEDKELRIRELLKRRMFISTRLQRRLKYDGGVWLNGQPVKQYEKAKPGDRLVVVMPEEASDFPAEEMDLDVVYEDQDLLIINKDPNVVVHPTRGHQSGTLTNGIMHHMKEKGETYKIRFINRLDMDTSGLVAVGKNSHSQDSFTRQAQKGQVEKIYKAVIKGIPDSERGTIDLPIGKPSEESIKRAIMADGYPSITHYEVIEKFEKVGYSIVKINLETGRTHQIRVHFSSIGYPLVGDHLYGEVMEGLMERQALHGEELHFFHPASNKFLELKADLPEDMKNLIRWLKVEERNR